jgi:anti-anti-sigma regulatory factor
VALLERPGAERLHVCLAGFVDGASVKDALVRAGDPSPVPLAVDLSEVTELDPSAVTALLRARQAQPLRCVNPSDAAERVLRATGAALVLGVSPR